MQKGSAERAYVFFSNLDLWPVSSAGAVPFSRTALKHRLRCHAVHPLAASATGRRRERSAVVLIAPELLGSCVGVPGSRGGFGNNRPQPTVLHSEKTQKGGVKMDIIDMARASGMAVLLDGRIGREEYQSVCGSLSALQRFADAVRQTTADQNGNQKRTKRPRTAHRKRHTA
jgi:hypothetical protein